jgi:hypothetical protein
MADWRGDGSGNKPEKKRPKEFPVIPKPEKPAGQQSDWRGRSHSGRRAGNASEDGPRRSWTGTPNPISSTQLPWRKYVALLVIGIGILATATAFIIWITYKQHPIPLYVTISSRDHNDEIGEVPFADKTWERHIQKGKSKRAINNIETIVEDGSADPKDNWLTRLGKGQWETKLSVGGGDDNITAIYVNAWLVRRYPTDPTEQVIAVDPAETEWVLVPKDGEPFLKVSSGLDPIPVHLLFERVAEKVVPNNIAVIGLDVHLPDAIANLGDLEFPKEAIAKAYNDLKPELRKKLVVVLPCDKGEENNLSPGLQCTAFGHYFLEGLRTGFGDVNGSLESFLEELRKRVEGWASDRRSVKQTPVFLKEGSLSKYKLYDWAAKAAEELVPPVIPKDKWEDCFNKLDSLWENFEKLRKSRHQISDPILFAKIESGLIQLEIIAESMPSTWKKRLDGVQADLDKAWAKFKVRGVSVIEDHYVARDKVAIENGKAWKEWKEFSDSFGNPNEASAKFNEETHEKLEKIKREDIQSNDWLELQVCRILCQEVDWNNLDPTDRDNVPKLIQKLLQNFQRIQELNHTFPKEAVSHLREALLRVDHAFLESVDFLILNAFNEAEKKADACRIEIDKIAIQATRLRDAIEFRDDVFHQAPHAMGFLMRWFRFNTDQDLDPGKMCKQWAQLVSAAFKVQRSLQLRVKGTTDFSADGSLIEPSESNQELLAALNKQIDEIAAKPRVQTNAPNVNEPIVIRGQRNAIRYPFLPLEYRKEYHRKIAEYLSRDPRKWETTGGTPPKMEHRPSELAEVFLRELEKQLGDSAGNDDNREIQTRYRSMLVGDLRSTSLLNTGINTGKPSETQRDELYASAFRQQWIANAIGQRAIADMLKLEDHPWGDPASLRAEWNREFRKLQQERLVLAGWGRDPLGPRENPIEPDNYYEILARKYDEVKPGEESERLLKEELKKEFADRKSSLMFKLSPSDSTSASTPEASRQLGLSSGYQGWMKNAPSASIHRGIASMVDQETAGQKPVSLELKPDTKVTLTGPIALRPKLCVSLRGHRRWVDNGREIRRSYVINYQREALEPSIQVRPELEKRNTVIILDCSGSMVEVKNGNKNYEKFRKAQDTVKQLLDLLAKGQRNGIKSQVALIAMGVSITKEGMKENGRYGWGPAKLNGNSLEEEQTWEGSDKKERRICVMNTRFMPANDSKLSNAVDNVNAKGFTPLYDSILVGYDLLLNNSLGEAEIAEIIVVSDGENDVAPYTNPKTKEKIVYKVDKTTTLDALEGKIKNRPGVDLYVYQVASDNNDSPETKNFFSKISTLRNTQKKTYRSFDDIQKELKSKFDLPEFKVEYVDGDSGVSTPPVTGNLNNNKGTQLPRPGRVQVRVGESVSQELTLQSNEKLILQYQPKSKPALSFMSAKDIGESEDLDLPMKLKSSAKGVSDFFAKTVASSDNSQKPSASIKMRWPSDSEPNEKFLARPRWMVGRIRAANRTVPITEFKYSDTHFPSFNTPEVDLRGNDGKWLSTSPELDLWYSDKPWSEVPLEMRKKIAFTKELSDFEIGKRLAVEIPSDTANDQGRGNKIGWVKRLAENRIEVELDGDPSWWVMVPGSEEVGHTFEEGANDQSLRDSKSTHVFQLGRDSTPGMKKPASDIYFINERGLDSLQDNDVILHYQCKLPLQ